MRAAETIANSSLNSLRVCLALALVACGSQQEDGGPARSADQASLKDDSEAQGQSDTEATDAEPIDSASEASVNTASDVTEEATEAGIGPLACEELSAEACSATTDCLLYRAMAYDAEGDCIGAGAFCGDVCLNDGAVITYAQGPDETWWQFSSTCIPPGWTGSGSAPEPANGAFKTERLCDQ